MYTTRGHQSYILQNDKFTFPPEHHHPPPTDPITIPLYSSTNPGQFLIISFLYSPWRRLAFWINGKTVNISVHEDSRKPNFAVVVGHDSHECPDPRWAKHLPEIEGSLQKRVRSKKKKVRLQKQEWFRTKRSPVVFRITLPNCNLFWNFNVHWTRLWNTLGILLDSLENIYFSKSQSSFTSCYRLIFIESKRG